MPGQPLVARVRVDQGGDGGVTQVGQGRDPPVGPGFAPEDHLPPVGGPAVHLVERVDQEGDPLAHVPAGEPRRRAGGRHPRPEAGACRRVMSATIWRAWGARSAVRSGYSSNSRAAWATASASARAAKARTRASLARREGVADGLAGVVAGVAGAVQGAGREPVVPAAVQPGGQHQVGLRAGAGPVEAIQEVLVPHDGRPPALIAAGANGLEVELAGPGGGHGGRLAVGEVDAVGVAVGPADQPALAGVALGLVEPAAAGDAPARPAGDRDPDVAGPAGVEQEFLDEPVEVAGVLSG